MPRPFFLHFQEIGGAALPLTLKPRHAEKFRECRSTDIGGIEYGKKTKRKRDPQIIRSLIQPSNTGGIQHLRRTGEGRKFVC